MNNSTKNDHIDAALEALKSQKSPDCAAVAREFGINRTPLYKRFRGKSVSQAESNQVGNLQSYA
jgi:DNA-binding phage protein